ncbi:hypothetical protein PA15_0301435 [Pseudomonas aeruginosa HB15]|nr:hypothetical protein HW05_05475 [Pseudomonas aeruginosa]ESQ66971.1 hypothetical protein PA15_0301435 [Pseudomonas aeruginosa HB15]KAJ16454.1 hypothetical protein M002_31110 [Pseudomonas aeruginosa ID4365]KKJ45779.1 hypothetical protein T648_18990 [Pseudomonas aeruginosa MRSN 317]
MRRQAAPEDTLRLLQHRPRTLCKILITWAIGILRLTLEEPTCELSLHRNPTKRWPDSFKYFD